MPIAPALPLGREETMLMTEAVTRTTCACGEPLWMELRWNGFYAVPVYYPDGQGPASNPETTQCPACGRTLHRGIVPCPAFTPLGPRA